MNFLKCSQVACYNNDFSLSDLLSMSKDKPDDKLDLPDSISISDELERTCALTTDLMALKTRDMLELQGMTIEGPYNNDP